MESPFPAYKGDEPYIFVSYAHRDDGLAYPEIQRLNDQGFNIWYDEGISPGSEWRSEIANAIANSRLMLFFVTAASAESEHCRKEVNFAADQQIPTIAIYLEPADLPAGLKMTLSEIQGILKYEIPEHEYRQKLNDRLVIYLGETPARSVKLNGKVQRNWSGRAKGAVLAAFSALAMLVIWLFYSQPHVVIGTEVVLAPQPQMITQVRPNSIAVLAFVDMSSDRSQEYMSDGIAEELLTLLAKIPALQVAARTSAFSFKGKDATISEIGKLLNVAYVLEGSVRTSGSRIRITAQLIKTLTDSHIWAETYERELEDIFAIQDDIAAEIVTNLKVSMTGEMPSLQLIDGEAYALYLQARHLLDQGSPESMRRAQELTTQVLTLAPDYAPALLQMTYFSENPVEVLDLVNRALAIDPDYAPALAALGGSAIVEGDLVLAAELISRAVALNPGDPDVLAAASYMNMTLGRSDVRLNEYIVARDPLNPSKVFELSTAYYMAGREEEYVTNARKVLALSPDMEFVHYVLSEHLLSQGDFTAALAEIEQEASEVYRLIGLICIYHSSGQQDKSDILLQELIEKVEKSEGNRRLTPYVIAWPLAHRGDADLAFEYLNKAMDTDDPYLWGILGNRSFAPLYDDPRWPPFLEKIGRSPSQLDAIEFNIILPDS